MRNPLSALFIAAFVATPVASFAESGPLRIEEGLGASVNGLGVQNTLEVSVRRSLFADPRPLLSQNHFSAGVIHSVTPAYTRLAGYVEISPLSIVDLRGGYERSAYFGTFGSIQSFSSYTDRFGDDARDLGKAGAKSSGASRFFLSPSLRMKVGSTVAAASADFEWWHANAAGPMFYEPARDTLLRADHDRAMVTTAYLMRLRDLGGRGRMGYGVRHSLTYVFDAPGNKSQRIGIVAFREFGDRRFGLRAPRVSGHVSYYLDDPNRRGQICAGLSLGFDLLARGSR